MADLSTRLWLLPVTLWLMALLTGRHQMGFALQNKEPGQQPGMCPLFLSFS